LRVFSLVRGVELDPHALAPADGGYDGGRQVVDLPVESLRRWQSRSLARLPFRWRHRALANKANLRIIPLVIVKVRKRATGDALRGSMIDNAALANEGILAPRRHL